MKKKKFIKKMSKGLGVIGGLATIVAPIVACGDASGNTDNKGSTDNKKDEFDVKTVLDGISGNEKVVNAKLINAVPEGTTLSDSLADDIGITLPTDVLGTTITYSHDAIDKDGDLVVNINVTKGKVNKDMATPLTIAVTGIDAFKDADGITTTDITVNKAQIDAVPDWTDLTPKAAELGITFPTNAKSTFEYKIDAPITTDGQHEIHIKATAHNASSEVTKQLKISGIEKHNIQIVLDGVGIPTDLTVDKAKIVGFSDDKDLNTAAAKELGITLPPTIPSGVEVKYTLNGITADSNLTGTIKVIKDSVTVHKDFSINVKGIDAHNALAGANVPDHASIPKSKIDAVTGWTALPDEVKNDWGITTSASPTATFKYQIPVAVTKDGTYEFKIQATSNTITYDKTISVTVTGINAHQASDVDHILGEMHDGNYQVTTNDKIDGKIGSLKAGESILGGAIAAPKDMNGVSILYAYPEISSNGDVNVIVTAMEGLKIKYKIVKITVTGFNDAKTVVDGITQLKDTVKFSDTANTTNGDFNDKAASELGFKLPTEKHGAKIKYVLTPPVTGTSYKLTVTATIGTDSSSRDFTLTINGKQDYLDIHDTMSGIKYIDGTDVRLNAEQSKAKKDQPLLPNNPFAITGVPSLAPGSLMKITFSHDAIASPTSTLPIVITVEQGGIKITKQFTLTIVYT